MPRTPRNRIPCDTAAPAPIERIKGKYRYLVLIRGEGLALVRQAVRVLALHRTPPKGIEFYIDVDPQSLL